MDGGSWWSEKMWCMKYREGVIINLYIIKLVKNMNNIEKEQMLVIDYMAANKLPPVEDSKIKDLPHEGYAVEYEKTGVSHVMDIRALMTTPGDLPVAVSYLGTAEEGF